MNRKSTPTISPYLLMIGIFFLLLSTTDVGWSSTRPDRVSVRMEYWAPYYIPVLALVPDGASIHILNPTSSPHTITHEACWHSESCAFDSGAVQPGRDFVISSLLPGKYSYYCRLHPIMKGEIVVVPRSSGLNRSSVQDLSRSRHSGVIRERTKISEMHSAESERDVFSNQRPGMRAQEMLDSR